MDTELKIYKELICKKNLELIYSIEDIKYYKQLWQKEVKRFHLSEFYVGMFFMGLFSIIIFGLVFFGGK